MYELITDDRPCGRCRYNLKGLPISGQCPECGAPILARGRSRRQFTDNLADAPRYYLKALALGLSLMAVGSIGSAWLFYLCARTLRLEYAIALTAATIIWWLGVVIASGQRALGESSLRDPILDTAWPRWSARIGQLLWLLVGVAWVVATRLPGAPGRYAEYAAQGLSLAGIVSLAPLTLILASLADWAGDSTLADRFRISLSTTIICAFLMVLGLILGLFSGSVAQSILVSASFALGLLVLAQVLFLWSLFQLTSLATWAIQNSATASITGQRSQERQQAMYEEIGARSATAGVLQQHGPPPQVQIPPVGSAFVGKTIESSDDLPYALEPEPPKDPGQRRG